MTSLEEAGRFYAERVPEQFNGTLENQRERAREDEREARVLEEMEAVRTSIVVRVDGGDETSTHAFDIERGRMASVARPGHPPFLILEHALADFENIRQECGESLLGFLGGLAGLGDEMRLTAQRVRSLRALAGCLVFERVGKGGFRLLACFGEAGEPTAPRATIRLDEEVYAQLRSGALEAQDAFFEERVEVEGDLEMAIGLALAALSPA